MKLSRPRIYLFDNLKGLLIFLVVLAHYLGTGFVYTNNSSRFVDAIYIFIYTFHMPLFCFISGFFSKDLDKTRNTAFFNIFVPYLFFNAVFVFLSKADISQILYPVGVMWYLLALFVWRILLRDLVRIRYIFIISVMSSIVSRFVFDGSQIILIRIFSFFPFFLLGYLTEKEHFVRIQKLPKTLFCTIPIVVFMSIVILLNFYPIPYSVPLFTKSLGINYADLMWFVWELISTMVGVVLSLCIINIMPNKKMIFTKIGIASMVIYIFHSFPYLRDLLADINPFEGAFLRLIYWVMLSLISVIVFGSDIFVGIYQKTMHSVKHFFNI